MPNEIESFDVVIVGAGAVGAACALSMASINPQLRIAVLEKNAAIEVADNDEVRNQRVWALGEAATTLLQDIGVMPLLGEQASYPYTAMHIWDENSNGSLNFTAKEQGIEQLGYMVDANQCTVILQDKLAENQSINCFYQTDLQQLKFVGNKAIVKSNAAHFSAQLLIAADGQNSWVRQQAKIFAPKYHYGQMGLVAKILTEKPHNETALQRFLSTGPIAVLPLAKQQSSIVWSVDDLLAKELLSLSKNDFELRLSIALENCLGKIRLISKLQGFTLTSRHAQTYIHPNLALIGDAAHNIHPLAGQGANLGFRDVTVLSGLVAPFERLNNYTNLQTYQRKRRTDSLQTDFLMSILHRGYQMKSPLISRIRGEGMLWLSNAPNLKKQLVDRALGH